MHTILKERKDKFECDNILDLVWDYHCYARSIIESYEIPYKKLKQAEKVRPNKQMSPKRIEITIGDPTSKCLLQESRL